MARFADLQNFPKERKKFNSLYSESSFDVKGEAEKICLVRPQTYMNLSGNAVRSFLGYFVRDIKEDLNGRLLVIYDDMDLPEGALRFKSCGSSGGHKGLQSILDHIGHDRFSRLKVGVGRKLNTEVKDYVLEKVSGKSLEALKHAKERSVEAVGAWLQEDVGSCMNRFNETED